MENIAIPGLLQYPTEAAATATRPQASGRQWMDGWMEVGSLQMGRQYVSTFKNRCFGTTNCFANMLDLTLPELFREIKLFSSLNQTLIP